MPGYLVQSTDKHGTWYVVQLLLEDLNSERIKSVQVPAYF